MDANSSTLWTYLDPVSWAMARREWKMDFAQHLHPAVTIRFIQSPSAFFLASTSLCQTVIFVSHSRGLWQVGLQIYNAVEQERFVRQ